MPRTDKPVTLSQRIKHARAQCGFSQSEAAQQWGINVRTLQDWEIERRQPRGFARAQLEKLLAGINDATGARPARRSRS